MTEGTAPRTAIIGAGIGGAALAFALQRSGVPSTVYERSAKLRASGAVLGLRPRTMELLDDWGLRAAYESEISTFEALLIRDAATGDVVSEQRLGDVGVDVVTRHVAIRRVDLLHLFTDRLEAATLRLGRRCVSVRADRDVALVEFDDGAIEEVDVVIGADGLRSTVRAALVADSEPIYAGVGSYPGFVDATLVADLLPDRLPSSWVRAGDGAFVLLMPAQGGRSIGFDAIIPQAREADDSWSRTITRSRLLEKLEGFDPRIRELIRRVPVDEFLALGLHDRETLNHFAAGRIALLGDAAHPLIPAEGQGVNLAIQDAASLGALLGRTGGAQLPEALLEYSRARVPVAAEIHRAARERHARMAGAGRGPAGGPQTMDGN